MDASLGSFACAVAMAARGGYKQRRLQAPGGASSIEAQTTRVHADSLSPLGRCLIDKWAWGAISAAMVQELAQAAVLSGRRAADVQQLAAIGSKGLHPGNAQRDLMAKFCKNLLPPEAFCVEVPMEIRVGANRSVAEMPVDILLPHEWLAALDAYPEVLGADGLMSFWSQHSLDDPKLQMNPMMGEEHWMEKFIPIQLHGDGVLFQKTDSLLVISMRSLLTRLPVPHSSLLLACLTKSVRVKNRTTDSWKGLWEVLVWSFRAAFAGVWPTEAPNGEPWRPEDPQAARAGQPLSSRGYRLFIYALTGDNDFFANEFGLNHTSSNRPCFKCGCNTSTVPWNDFRPQAAWKQTVFAAEENRRNPPTSHIVLSIPGVRAETVALDVMHTVDLGVTCHAVGSLFFELIYDRLLPGSRSEAAAALCAKISTLQEDLGVPVSSRLRNFKLENITDPDAPNQSYPCLRYIKARECRYLASVAVALSREFETESLHSKHRTKCMEALERLYDTIDHGDVIFTRRERLQFRSHCEAFLSHYSWLAKSAMQQRQLRWSVVPKFHLSAHLPDQAEYINPRCTWAYAGEHMVGLMAALGQSCLSGTPAWLVCRTLVAKYRVAMHLRITKCIDDA